MFLFLYQFGRRFGNFLEMGSPTTEALLRTNILHGQVDVIYQFATVLQKSVRFNPLE